MVWTGHIAGSTEVHFTFLCGLGLLEEITIEVARVSLLLHVLVVFVALPEPVHLNLALRFVQSRCFVFIGPLTRIVRVGFEKVGANGSRLLRR